MKRFSQTLRVMLALVVATFGTSVVPTAAVYAMEAEGTTVAKEQIEVAPQTAEPDSSLLDNSATDTQGAPLVDEADKTPSEPVVTTTDVAPKTDDEDVVVDEKDSNESMVQTLLSPDTTQRQSLANEVEAPVKKVTFCHATPPEDAKNGWNKLNTAVEVVFNAGHDSEHLADIIPPFYYEKQGETLHFAGLNWDEKGQAIFENDCVDDTVVIEEPFLQTYHDASVCGQITISLRNASPWMYRVLIEKSTDGESWVRAYGSVSGAGIQANTTTGGVLEVNNLGEAVPDDRTGHYTVTFAEDSGTYELRYKVSSGTEQDLYVGLPVGEYTYIENIVSDCLDNPVTPTAPSVVDLCYDDRDGIFVIDNSRGLRYYVGEQKVNGMQWVPFTGAPITVTAVAKNGYEIPEGVAASWTYTADHFTDKQCLTITKSAKVASDINLDGIINVGDTVTWTITVTNISDEDYEAFKVKVDDPNAALEGNGYIKYLGAGKSKTLTATSTVTANDLAVCKVVNTANFSGWRLSWYGHDYDNNNDVSRMTAPEREGRWTMPEALATGSATGTYNLYCPEPEQPGGQVLGTQAPTAPQVLATSTALPEVLPATGGGSEANYTLLGIVLSAAVYYFVLRRQTAEA